MTTPPPNGPAEMPLELKLPLRFDEITGNVYNAEGLALARFRYYAVGDAIVSAVNERDALRAQVEALREALLSCEASLNTIAEGGNISMAEALGACRRARAALASPAEKGAG